MVNLPLEQFIESEEWVGKEGRLPDGRYKSTWDAIDGVWNIGPGLTNGVTRDTVMTKEQIDQAYAKELGPFEEGVRKYVKVPVTNNQFTALVSFAYNVGLSDFHSSTLLRLLNSGEANEVPAQLKLWVHGRATGKKVIPGLENRRRAECEMWNTPDGPSMQPQDYVPHYDPASPVPKGAATLEMKMSSPSTMVNVPLNATTAIISQLGHKVVTATQGGLIAIIAYVFTHFNSVWDLLSLNSSTISVYAATAIVGGIEWYKHTWVQNSNETTAAIIDSLETKLKELEH